MVRLTFLGTRAGIDEKTEQHYYHSSILLQSFDPYPFRILIDYGMIHAYDMSILKPDVILVTHAHADHYIWSAEELNCAAPVYLTQETLQYGQFHPVHYHLLTPYHLFSLGPFQVLPYRVMHSSRCPAVGFKIQLPDDQILLYNPDLAGIIAKEQILSDVDYYIGDGSCYQKNLVREKGQMLYGHIQVPLQISWGKDYKFHKTIFTHIGEELMSDKADLVKNEQNVILAYDSMKLLL